MRRPDEASDAPLRVVIADDHAFFRHGLARMLEDHGIDVVAEAPDGPTAIAAARALDPDVVVLDLSMPGMTGQETTRRLLEQAPGIPILILTVSADPRDVAEALSAGANGYVLKDASSEEVLEAITCIAEGESALSPRVAEQVLRRFRTERS